MRIDIEQATDRRSMRDFITFPESLYHNDKNFVPHLLLERLEFFSKKNPTFEHLEARYFLARDSRATIIGRVSAHIHELHNSLNGDTAGFFGFFECIDNVEVAQALMGAAEAWLRSKGMTRIQGPYNFSTNDECGFLVDCFDRPPTFMMTYTKPYYPAFFEKIGYTKARDLFAYHYHYQGSYPDLLLRFEKRSANRHHIKIRPVDLNEFDREIETIFSLYNAAWEMNWGFIPMTEPEFRHLANKLKMIIDPTLALIAEIDGTPVAFSLSLPDYNELLIRAKGRLLPFGFFHLFFGRKRIKKIRLILLGIIKEFRGRGIDISLYFHTFKNAYDRGYRSGEISWVLEDNIEVRNAVRRIGGTPEKTYRIYEKSLKF